MTEKPPQTPELSRRYAEYEDEISLIDLWLVLARRKWLVLGIALLTLLLAGLYAWTRTPMYESRAVVAVGSMGEHGFLEQPDAVVQRLTEEYHVDDSSEEQITPPYVDEVQKEGGRDSSAVSITVQDTSAAGAQRYAKQVVGKLLTEHNDLFQQALKAQKMRLKSLNDQIAGFDAQMKSLSEHIEALKSRDPAQSAILAVEKGKLLEEKPALEEQRVELELAVSGLKAQPTKLIRSPSLPRGPSNIKTKLYLALGLVLGLMLGVFAAFFAEFLARAREEMHAREAGSGK